MNLLRLGLAGILALGLILPAPAQAQGVIIPGPCAAGELPSGALSLICIPDSGWNGDLVVFAHGYVAFNEPLDFYHLTLPDGASLPLLVQSLGYAFATTSYRQNGLTVLEGADDIRELVAAFRAAYGIPPHTYLTGVSEGGLVATLLAEQSPELFSGGLAACGPIGNFRKQINYLGDFRVLFDYFFPSALPPSPISIPSEVIENWEAIYVPAITARLATDPRAAIELIRTSRAAIDPSDPASIAATTINVLWYNVFGANDLNAELGGNPYDNTRRWYWGSNNDLRLNRRVQRFSADPVALANLIPYQTSGHLTIPLVTLHTTGDEIIPFWHELLYLGKFHPSGQGSFLPIPIFRYGHCNFTANEVLAAFGLLVWQVTGGEVGGLAQRFDVEQVRRDFARAQREFAEAQQAPAMRVPHQYEIEHYRGE